MTVPASNSGEYRSWVYADLATICHKLARVSYGRTLLICVVSPSQPRPPRRLISRPSATSSMRAPLIGSSPPEWVELGVGIGEGGHQPPLPLCLGAEQGHLR